ncbi:MAG: tRNA uracil 4-sulfurtransferase ThiI [Gemmatimonadales bacterium]|jgi:thiamine biosynthesis protein ThiI
MMHHNEYPYRVLIRPSGELATKSRHTRRRFQHRIVECLEDALASSGIGGRVLEEWGRLFAETDSPAALDIVPRVFGIASVSHIEAMCEARRDSIIELGASLYAERVSGKTFAVRTRRSGRHDFKSKDINYGLGAALNRYADVDLGDPDVTVGVEIRDEIAYLFSARVPGAGGLPLGMEGRAVALISGGYDSAVAAWMMLKRGVALDYVFCNLAGGAYERSVLGVAKVLADEWSYGTRPRIHVVDFEDVVRLLKERVRESYWQVVLKRLMYRVGETVAEATGAMGIVTGEAIGQVSSQTLANLRAIDGSATVPVFRPLLGFDKAEIIDRSRTIGTYPLSEKVREYCALTERKPITDATAEDTAAEEAKFDLAVLESVTAARRTLDLRELDASELVLPYLYTTEIPDDALIIDARPRSQYEPWHYPGAIHRDFWEILADFKSLDRDRLYVLYCELGLKTAQLAEKMQRAGYEAYSFKGGLRGIREYADREAAGA